MAFEWHLMAPKALEEAIRLWRRLPERAEAVACAQYLSVSVLLRMFDPKDLFHSKRNKKSSFRFLLTLFNSFSSLLSCFFPWFFHVLFHFLWLKGGL